MTNGPSAHLDWSFPREYDIVHFAGLGNPATLPQIYYPGAAREGGSVGLMVRVIPKRATLELLLTVDCGPCETP